VTRIAPSTSKFTSWARRRSPLISRKIPTSTSTQATGLTNITTVVDGRIATIDLVRDPKRLTALDAE
jgi:hypothetical protein